jgi:5-(carboxyamino)imidazole ribonucleotide synthase
VHDIGFVGAGRLARMAGEAASALGLSTAVLATRAGDAACDVASEVLIGSPFVEGDMRALAERCRVITFDHEQVDLTIVAALEREGVAVRPGAAALEMAVDKAHMRTVLDAAGVPVPTYRLVDAGPDALEAVTSFAAEHGWPVVLKSARGGYDGKGVWPVPDPGAARDVLHPLASDRDGASQIVVEELVPLDAELAVVVARTPSGSSGAWPAVETAQVGGVCREVLVPGRLDRHVVEAAGALAQKVAEIAGSVGVMAVELFWSGGRLLVNEVATRPHNSGHWTMEGAVTSQFENHVRAVLDLPLGATSAQHAQVASVNVFGGSTGEDPACLVARGLAVEGAHVHLYGKEAKPGRKLGHVTVCGGDPQLVRTRAWSAAVALGTPVPEELVLPDGVRS